MMRMENCFVKAVESWVRSGQFDHACTYKKNLLILRNGRVIGQNFYLDFFKIKGKNEVKLVRKFDNECIPIDLTEEEKVRLWNLQSVIPEILEKKNKDFDAAYEEKKLRARKWP